jgi:hypothetical protein
VIYRQVSGTVRDGFLSFFTLLNYDGEFYSSADPDPRPLNRKHLDGFAAPFAIPIGKLQFAVYPRQEYAQPFQNGDHALKFFLFWDLLVGSLFTTLSRLVGCLAAMAVSRTFDPIAWFESLLWRIPLGWVTFMISLYMAKEGDTDEGRYNAGGAAFDGYPPHDSSPYTLPYAKDVLQYVGQANHGIFSHNFMNVEQTYSYDFSMDEDAIVLASRPGTVVDYFDWVPDDTNPDEAETDAARAEAVASGFLVAGQTRRDYWNFIAIRHDLDDSLSAALPDATHDKGPGGTVVTTYAIYGHGRKNSVRELFGDRAVLPGAIIGTQVRRGDRIIRCGDTGISFHNHLHMMVQEGPAAGSPVDRSTLPDATLPFVFRDVTHFIGRDGVCKNLNFYTSSTEVQTT